MQAATAGRATAARRRSLLIDAVLTATMAPFGATLVLSVATVVPTLFGFESYVVVSGSMEPTIPVGAVVVTRPVPLDSLRPGDIISFQAGHQPGVVVTHRLIQVEQADGQRELQTKGDANPSPDIGTVDQTQPIARLAYWVPWAGYLSRLLADNRVRLLVLGLGLLLVWLLLQREQAHTSRMPAAAANSRPADGTDVEP